MNLQYMFTTLPNWLHLTPIDQQQPVMDDPCWLGWDAWVNLPDESMSSWAQNH